MQNAAKSAKFFKEAGYRSTTNPRDGLFQYAFQTKLSMFEFFGLAPSMQRDFDIFMGSATGARKSWVDWYPVKERLLSDLDKHTPLVVDVGGGNGHDLEKFSGKFPGAGKLILQDQAHVLESVKDLSPFIERIPLDFFTEQPVKDARVYFCHHILHDWSDDKCLEILRSIKSAMRPEYSKLLLNEMILPDTGCHPFAVDADMTMMVTTGGMERSKAQWKTLLEAAGFQIVQFWVDEEDGDGIVEAVIRDH